MREREANALYYGRRRGGRVSGILRGGNCPFKGQSGWAEAKLRKSVYLILNPAGSFYGAKSLFLCGKGLGIHHIFS